MGVEITRRQAPLASGTRSRTSHCATAARRRLAPWCASACAPSPSAKQHTNRRDTRSKEWGGIELTGRHERTCADWHRTCAGSQLAGKHASHTKSKQTGRNIWRAYKQKQTLYTHEKSGELTAGWTACRHEVRMAEAERRRALAQAARREAVTRGSSPGAHSGSVGSTDRYTCAQSARVLSAFSATPGPRARNSACAIVGPNVWQFLITHAPSQAPIPVRDARCMPQPRLNYLT